ncbi:MAG TPA: hypothetical protein VEA78_10905, partial [Acidimicrobiales bacterium]|nr:hypothetical protein [Acidimicrobiales bacterium]
VQLVVDEATWRARVGADEARPPIDDFFAERYRAAQVTPADHVVDTTDRPADAVARAVMAIIGS